MTRSTCTCNETLEFVVFLLNFILFQIDYHRRNVGKPSSLSYRQALGENLISGKLGIWT